MDMRTDTETALARVMAVFGAAKSHCAYLLANRRANSLKVMVHNGIGVWRDGTPFKPGQVSMARHSTR